MLTCPTAKYDCNDVSLVWFRECWRLVSLLLKGRIFFFWHLVSVAFERSFFHALPGIFHLFHGFRSHFSYLSPSFSMSSMRSNSFSFCLRNDVYGIFPHVSLNLEAITTELVPFDSSRAQDSEMVHIAWICGTIQITISGPSGPRRTGPASRSPATYELNGCLHYHYHAHN